MYMYKPVVCALNNSIMSTCVGKNVLRYHIIMYDIQLFIQYARNIASLRLILSMTQRDNSPV